MAPLSDFGQTAGLRLSTLWSPAYLVTSVGGVSRATIHRYIAKRSPRRRRASRETRLSASRPPDPGRHSFTAQQQTLRRLNAIFGVYFKRARDAKRNVRRVGYPRFKPYRRFDQVLFVSGDGAKWQPADSGRWA